MPRHDFRQPTRRPLATLATLALCGALAGCGFNVREELGLIGQGPDEFAVVKKKPLVMPSDMTELPEPRPGAPSLVDPRPSEDAQRALTGQSAPASARGAAPSASESAFLDAAGADRSDPAIREKLNEEAEDDDGRLLDPLISSIRGEDDTEADALDPAKEADRLSEIARQEKNPGLEPLPQPEP